MFSILSYFLCWVHLFQQNGQVEKVQALGNGLKDRSISIQNPRISLGFQSPALTPFCCAAPLTLASLGVVVAPLPHPTMLSPQDKPVMNRFSHGSFLAGESRIVCPASKRSRSQGDGALRGPLNRKGVGEAIMAGKRKGNPSWTNHETCRSFLSRGQSVSTHLQQTTEPSRKTPSAEKHREQFRERCSCQVVQPCHSWRS